MTLTKQRKEYMKEYYQRPEVKIRRRECQRERRKKPEVKAKEREYRQRLEVKQRRKELRQRPEVKEKQKKYRQKPEVKVRRKKYIKEYTKNNKDKVDEYYKEYYKRPEVKKRKREYEKQLRKKPEFKVRERKYKQKPKYKARRREYTKKRLKTDKNFSIIQRLRKRKNKVIRRAIKTGIVPKDSEFMGVKIDYKAIIEALKPFPEDISLYHIDHRKPLCSFDLTNPEEIRVAFAPENHQWLLASENMSKGGRLKKFK